MRTAIFVYQTTPLCISTNESNLQLRGMNADAVSLSAGDNAQTLLQGIYKIVSNQELSIRGDGSTFEIVITPSDKDNDPRLFTPRVTETFPSLDPCALQEFMVVPEAKVVLAP